MYEVEGKNILIVGFTGRAKSGKSTAANALGTRLNHNYGIPVCVRAFADPIREIGHIFGFSDDQMNLQSFKEQINERWGISPRKFMQLVGSEMFRTHIGPDVWVKHMFDLGIPKWVNAVKNYSVYALDKECAAKPVYACMIGDVRFKNEADAIHNRGGLIVRINRPDVDDISNGVQNHVSEKEFDLIQPDIVIDNIFHNVQEFRDFVVERVKGLIVENPQWSKQLVYQPVSSQ